MVAGAHRVVELDHLDIAQQYAAGAGGAAEAVFVIRAVDVDVALVGIDFSARIVAGLKAAQPKDAGSDEIARTLVVCELGEMFPGADAGLEHDSGRGAGPDAFGDFVEAVGR